MHPNRPQADATPVAANIAAAIASRFIEASGRAQGTVQTPPMQTSDSLKAIFVKTNFLDRRFF